MYFRNKKKKLIHGSNCGNCVHNRRHSSAYSARATTHQGAALARATTSGTALFQMQAKECIVKKRLYQCSICTMGLVESHLVPERSCIQCEVGVPSICLRCRCSHSLPSRCYVCTPRAHICLSKCQHPCKLAIDNLFCFSN
jgi:hypothetical protein